MVIVAIPLIIALIILLYDELYMLYSVEIILDCIDATINADHATIIKDAMILETGEVGTQLVNIKKDGTLKIFDLIDGVKKK